MQTVQASEFKAKCLGMVDQVAQTHEAILITKHGKPVARLCPAEAKPPRPSMYGALKGWMTIDPSIDLTKPMIPEEDWDFDQENT